MGNGSSMLADFCSSRLDVEGRGGGTRSRLGHSPSRPRRRRQQGGGEVVVVMVKGCSRSREVGFPDPSHVFLPPPKFDFTLPPEPRLRASEQSLQSSAVRHYE